MNKQGEVAVAALGRGVEQMGGKETPREFAQTAELVRRGGKRRGAGTGRAAAQVMGKPVKI